MHYWQISSVKIDSMTDKARDEMIAKLRKSNPALAKKLEKVDWKAVTAHVAKEALQMVAAEEKANLTATYDNSGHRTNHESDTLGVLSKDGCQLGVAMTKDGTLSFYQNGRSNDYGSAQLDRWRKKFNEAYRVRAYAAVLEILGKKVTVVKDESGAYVIKAKVEVK